eukprot:GEZU01029704.1.p1 GENE.GEZU01029704.1~~GEZU01029704.1.p1  ORF type:complete len:139 (-),score=72.27 GEZU01029704.1:235-651(-)
MSSGVGVNDECIQEYNLLKMNQKYRFILFKMNDSNTEIVVDTTSTENDYDAFIKALPPADCRYVVYDFEFDTDGGKRNKIVFLNWAPEKSKIKNKMLYAASKDAFKKKLVGLGLEVQATDLSEVARQEVLDKCLALSR